MDDTIYTAISQSGGCHASLHPFDFGFTGDHRIVCYDDYWGLWFNSRFCSDFGGYISFTSLQEAVAWLLEGEDGGGAALHQGTGV
jgi:hypothetical protein